MKIQSYVKLIILEMMKVKRKTSQLLHMLSPLPGISFFVSWSRRTQDICKTQLTNIISRLVSPDLWAELDTWGPFVNSLSYCHNFLFTWPSHTLHFGSLYGMAHVSVLLLLNPWHIVDT